MGKREILYPPACYGQDLEPKKPGRAVASPAIGPAETGKEKAVRQGSDPSGSPFSGTVYIS
jgi:hypothetical protein